MADVKTQQQPAWQTPSTWRWNTREIVLVAVLAVVFGFLYVQWLPIYTAAKGFGAQAGQEAVFGFWFIAGLLSAYIVRKPGAAVIGNTLAAFVEIYAFGAAAGPLLLVTGFMQGIGAEVVFAITRYRRWDIVTMVVAGMVAAVGAIPWNWGVRLGYFALDPGFLVVLFFVRLASSAVAALVSKLVGDALERTGVLSGFAIGRDRLSVV